MKIGMQAVHGLSVVCCDHKPETVETVLVPVVRAGIDDLFQTPAQIPPVAGYENGHEQASADFENAAGRGQHAGMHAFVYRREYFLWTGTSELIPYKVPDLPAVRRLTHPQ